ncbi:cob(I)yrinic acid a,c-diamide adenosyltransferase [Sulfoacidibacillus thermotolerans]|uniref:Corrinoid adenosyltransferase n=1 Tax=Sulfoacidibacillus thermotolerans TaxID=1765684 RepID=A0A2U3DBS2_SULT2|nr:cob(I)yrinic acid a,c-diamide adenosyltransferase [Sulfoacidibacillus thermotolerans]PWI58726.1 ATP:cob(I)alamin adenosyltransferase [Sulfoacidibacillus thermotolerans]
MRIYTRGGDKGKTALVGGERRFKNNVRIEAYGAIDEAGAFIGLAAAELQPQRDEDILEILRQVQQTLWDVGADLARPVAVERPYRTALDAAAKLEPLIDTYKEQADRLTKFVLRGGNRAAASMHVACTVVRRAERRIVQLMQEEEIHPVTLQYVNRLSDLLFVLARAINARDHFADIEYQNSPLVFREKSKSNER